MPQFDVHRLAKGLVVNCQSDLLEPIDSRLVVPLIPRANRAKSAERLNPVLKFRGEESVLLTQAAAAVRRSELGTVVGSLADRSFEVTGALDVLLTGV